MDGTEASPGRRGIRQLSSALYVLGVALLFTHELDAVALGEWRLLYVLRNLPDPEGRALFIGLHLPLFVALLWLGHHERPRLRDATRAVVCGFLVVHAVLHWRLSDAPAYRFHGVASQIYIFGAALVGAAALAALSRRSRDRTSDGG